MEISKRWIFVYFFIFLEDNLESQNCKGMKSILFVGVLKGLKIFGYIFYYVYMNLY